ncbi:unnamed protein product, partial [Staurois parvus]
RGGWRTQIGGVEDTDWRDWQRGWRTLIGGIGSVGWRTLIGGQWRDWQRGVEDTDWRSVEGLEERGGGH